MRLTDEEHGKKLKEIYEERQRRIDEIYLMYNKGEITKLDKDSFLKAVDQDAKQKIIKLEKLYFSDRRTY